MLDIALLREKPEDVKRGIAAKNADPRLVDEFVALDAEWRAQVKKIDDLRAAQKEAGRARDIEKAKKLKDELKALESTHKELEAKREGIFLELPNLPLPEVPVGKNAEENKVLREVGEKPEFDFEPRDYMELAEELDIIDTKKAAEVSGARFSYLKGGAALLEIALMQYVVKLLTDKKKLKKIADKVKKGYAPEPFTPVFPPAMIRPEIFKKMARLTEADKDERYHLPKDDLYLVGSAEHTLGPLHMNESIEEKVMPRRYVGFSSSFRREAGSYGKDTHGILRVHQFDKLEMESFTVPEDGVHEQNFFVAIQEYMMQELGLPYRVVQICTGDMGAPDARQIDIEAWLPGQNTYKETHTADYMGDYQARRLHTKIKRANGESVYAHMNDATAFAIGRTIIAIIENYQTKEGTINMPKALQKYVGKKLIKHA